jgi:hypothetical protein
MSYMQDIDRWLDGLLAALPEDARTEAKRAIRAKILESYHNGQAAGPKRPADKGRPNQSTTSHGR